MVLFFQIGVIGENLFKEFRQNISSSDNLIEANSKGQILP